MVMRGAVQCCLLPVLSLSGSATSPRCTTVGPRVSSDILSAAGPLPPLHQEHFRAGQAPPMGTAWSSGTPDSELHCFQELSIISPFHFLPLMALGKCFSCAVPRACPLPHALSSLSSLPLSPSLLAFSLSRINKHLKRCTSCKMRGSRKVS